MPLGSQRTPTSPPAPMCETVPTVPSLTLMTRSPTENESGMAAILPGFAVLGGPASAARRHRDVGGAHEAQRDVLSGDGAWLVEHREVVVSEPQLEPLAAVRHDEVVRPEGTEPGDVGLVG